MAGNYYYCYDKIHLICGRCRKSASEKDRKIKVEIMWVFKAIVLTNIIMEKV